MSVILRIPTFSLTQTRALKILQETLTLRPVAVLFGIFQLPSYIPTWVPTRMRVSFIRISYEWKLWWNYGCIILKKSTSKYFSSTFLLLLLLLVRINGSSSWTWRWSWRSWWWVNGGGQKKSHSRQDTSLEYLHADPCIDGEQKEWGGVYVMEDTEAVKLK